MSPLFRMRVEQLEARDEAARRSIKADLEREMEQVTFRLERDLMEFDDEFKHAACQASALLEEETARLCRLESKLSAEIEHCSELLGRFTAECQRAQTYLRSNAAATRRAQRRYDDIANGRVSPAQSVDAR